MHDRAAQPEFLQRSFADLGQPLVDTTFAVIDFETTGGSPQKDVITEIGAVKVKGGEFCGTLSTLVNPGRAIPPTITVLTGITESMVTKAPRIESVLGTLMDFIGDAVIVGHNVRFDVGFLQAALERDGRPPLEHRTIDTVALSRRLLGEEVPNCKLSTLASRLRLANQPSHRALADALATADLLHVLMERAAAFGVLGLDDLASLPKMASHPQAKKLALTQRLPRSPGIYLFRDPKGHVLYVGKATDLRSRVRSYFSSDDRRKVGALLREAGRIDHKVCSTTLEASVLEARLIRDLTPPYNSQGTRWRKSCYLRLTMEENFPRLSVVRKPGKGEGVLFGPIGSTRRAKLVAEAIESAIPLRRCTGKVPKVSKRSGPCAPAQLGVSTCPCAGDISQEQYRSHVESTLRAVEIDIQVLFAPLSIRMEALAADERFEEAGAVRDRLEALASTIARQRRFDSLLRCERLVLRIVVTGERIEMRRGILWRIWPAPDRGQDHDLWHGQPDAGLSRQVEMRPEELPSPQEAVAKGLADELTAVAAWLERHSPSVILEWVEGEYSSRIPAVPRFAAKKATASRRQR